MYKLLMNFVTRARGFAPNLASAVQGYGELMQRAQRKPFP